MNNKPEFLVLDENFMNKHIENLRGLYNNILQKSKELFEKTPIMLMNQIPKIKYVYLGFNCHSNDEGGIDKNINTIIHAYEKEGANVLLESTLEEYYLDRIKNINKDKYCYFMVYDFNYDKEHNLIKHNLLSDKDLNILINFDSFISSLSKYILELPEYSGLCEYDEVIFKVFEAEGK